MVSFLSYIVNRFCKCFTFAAESTKQPSEVEDESSKSNGNKFTNLKDGDDKVKRQGMNRLLADLDTVLRLKEILKKYSNL